jgi:uncharacterized protein (DUF58 family)
MIIDLAKPFTYHIPWKSSSAHFGEHRGTQRGLGYEYRGNLPLVDYPDARRMDLRQTLRDPYEQVQVKVYHQDNTTPVYALCDLSSSMQYQGRQRKMDKAAEIAASVACSAFDAGDVFSFIGYDQSVIDELTLPLSYDLHHVLDVIGQLHQRDRKRIGAEGILEVPQYLSQSRGLVFWISDFHMPLGLIEQALNAMSRHQIVPVVLWEEQEHRKLPRFGFGTLIDPETGMRRTILFREALREKFERAFEARKVALDGLFLRYDSPALFLEGAFKPEIMSQYFEQYMSL